MAIGLDDKINLVAIYAAVVSTFGLLWQIWQWWHHGPRLVVSARSGMKMVVGPMPDPDSYIAINVSNNGDRKTTITHVHGYTYTNNWNRLRNLPANAFIVGHQTQGQNAPFEIDAGSTFMSLFRQEEELEQWSRTLLLYVGISHSGARRPILKRIPAIRASAEQL